MEVPDADDDEDDEDDEDDDGHGRNNIGLLSYSQVVRFFDMSLNC